MSIMRWNYRLTKRTIENPIDPANTTMFEIREVYYGDNDEIVAWSKNPVDISAESIEDIAGSMKLMFASLNKPALDLDELSRTIG